jgi:hypothetical protein
MNKLQTYLDRLQTGANESHKLSDLPAWIESNTSLKGAKFSFKGREYQRKIIKDESQEVHIVKSSQTGVSEIFARWALGLSETRINYIQYARSQRSQGFLQNPSRPSHCQFA